MRSDLSLATAIVIMISLAATSFANQSTESITESQTSDPPNQATILGESHKEIQRKSPNANESVDNVFAYKIKLGAQAVALTDIKDTDSQPFGLSADETQRFGIHRMSAVFSGNLLNFASLKLHALSMPMTEKEPFSLVDVHLIFKMHPSIHLKLGRFKKTFTSVYSPFWAEWYFFDVPKAFKYIKGNLGLGGRGEGAMLFGSLFNRRFRYSVGVYNGLEEAKPWTKSSALYQRSDESVQWAARIVGQLLPSIHVSAGVAYLPSSYLTITQANSNPDQADSTKTQSMSLLAYAGQIRFHAKRWLIQSEFIGHAIMSEVQPTSLGGGVYADILYLFSLPFGDLRSGVRYARHWADFDQAKNRTESYTVAVNWLYQKTIRVGLELGYLDETTKGLTGLHGLIQVAFVR